MNELVQRLSESQPVEVILHPERTYDALRRSIELGVVHLKFHGARGNTELAVYLEPNAIPLYKAALDHPNGEIQFNGHLTLNDDRVRCSALICLESFTGQGRLELLED